MAITRQQRRAYQDDVGRAVAQAKCAIPDDRTVANIAREFGLRQETVKKELRARIDEALGSFAWRAAEAGVHLATLYKEWWEDGSHTIAEIYTELERVSRQRVRASRSQERAAAQYQHLIEKHRQGGRATGRKLKQRSVETAARVDRLITRYLAATLGLSTRTIRRYLDERKSRHKSAE